ncbi:MAG: cadherin-like domain-containing protein [Verrucomicrobia bacterium]|nr:cadherin-like domain-containing protein [Verrucomicrobiota bacterium]
MGNSIGNCSSPTDNALCGGWIPYDSGTVTLPENGTYTLRVFPANFSTGTYSFKLNGMRPPLAGDDFAATTVNRSVDLPITRLLANDTDPDGDLVSFDGLPSAATSQGGSVLVVGDAVRYQPPTGFIGEDTFSYWINDGFGNSATATVTVHVRDSSQLGHNTIALVVNPDGSVDVTLAGIPGRNYQVWGASAVTGPWTNLGTATADAHGVVHFTDTTAGGAPARFYHLANP